MNPTQASDWSQSTRPNLIDEILYYTILATSLRSLLPPQSSSFRSVAITIIIPLVVLVLVLVLVVAF